MTVFFNYKQNFFNFRSHIQDKKHVSYRSPSEGWEPVFINKNILFSLKHEVLSGIQRLFIFTRSRIVQALPGKQFFS